MLTSLNTDRLTLRPLTMEDVDFIIDLETRPENKRYETEGIPSRDDIIKSCEWFIQHGEKLPSSGGVMYIVLHQGTTLGMVSLVCNWEKTNEWEIGYNFLREFWGKGYAYEATKRVIHHAFDMLSIHKLMAFINAENASSIALAERLGMVKEGHMRDARLVDGKRYDEAVYSLLKSDLS